MKTLKNQATAPRKGLCSTLSAFGVSWLCVSISWLIAERPRPSQTARALKLNETYRLGIRHWQSHKGCSSLLHLQCRPPACPSQDRADLKWMIAGLAHAAGTLSIQVLAKLKHSMTHRGMAPRLLFFEQLSHERFSSKLLLHQLRLALKAVAQTRLERPFLRLYMSGTGHKMAVTWLPPSISVGFGATSASCMPARRQPQQGRVDPPRGRCMGWSPWNSSNRLQTLRLTYCFRSLFKSLFNFLVSFWSDLRSIPSFQGLCAQFAQNSRLAAEVLEVCRP